MTTTPQPQSMDMPSNLSLPLFVYGALKPGLPAFEQLRPHVDSKDEDSVAGALLVRDGLPLLQLTQAPADSVNGYLLEWKSGQEHDAYTAVCAFEPRKHFQWEEVTLKSGRPANALVVCYPGKGNPQHLGSSDWSLTDDPAFGPGLRAIERALCEVDAMPGNTLEENWERFFRSQMAYLLLWSILERLSALCFGPGIDPMKRIKLLHKLPGMSAAIANRVHRSDRVTDSRDPTDAFRLDAGVAKQTCLYYYQVRSNLSHRGKGVFAEFDKVHLSLKELLAITGDVLATIKQQEAANP